MSFNLPNPSLLGLILVISTHNGPQLVFKYPNNLAVKPQDEELENDEYRADDSDSDTESSEDEWDTRHYNFYSGTKKDILSFLDDQDKHRNIKSDKASPKPPRTFQENIGLGIKNLGGSNGRYGHRARKSEDSVSVDTSNFLKKTVSGISDSQSNNSKVSIGRPESTTIFGIEQDYLIEMLCPPKEMCNSRFEINIDDYIFSGLPVHCYDNGTWRKKTKIASNTDSTNLDDSVDSPRTTTSMTSFHLVFIAKPPVIESNYRIDEMYHYVVSRLSLVLRHEQSKHDYVWSQVRLISKLKEDFKNQNIFHDLTSFLNDKSSLCKLISDCYNAISSSQIANLSINSKLRSFQIPVKTEFYSIPDSTVPYLPGSHLSSTVNMIGKTGLINVGETARYGITNSMSMMMGGNLVDQNDGDIDELNDEDADSSADDIIYLSLLLLDDPERIITDIKAESDSTLASFIRMIKPTETLLRLSHKLKADSSLMSLDISQIKSFAFHLIYWRRARAIPPLNTRSSYIVSPMAPITTNMYEDIAEFKKAFSTMPSLPQFLKLLSSPTKKPRQFATIIPSKDHREIYLDALAWLIRFGYVTKLNTFIWLKVSKKVKIKVEEDMENEALNMNFKTSERKKAVQGTDNTSKVVEKPSLSNVSNPSSYEKDIDDIVMGIKNINQGPEIVLEDDEDTIILDPARANALERRWINKVVTEECKLSPELTVIFFSLLKYMNGKNSLELILLKENIPRNDFRRLLIQIEDHLISVRHW
ncbi:Nitrogen permease regulator 3 [Yamadazyma tenuis]|uniref:Nitrogen permease regulator 3 n=1 Tax=Candida tenuis TaxID=2315449 RepID=UPI0027A3A48B|nr:Nitrogen permease regulator 3 [Yamadazyma tenuis]